MLSGVFAAKLLKLPWHFPFIPKLIADGNLSMGCRTQHVHVPINAAAKRSYQV